MSRIEPEEQDFDPDTFGEEDAARALDEGVRLFNEGRFKDAHEEFEKGWLANEAGAADFHKGLVQACICLHHVTAGDQDGARKLYRGHRALLGTYRKNHIPLSTKFYEKLYFKPGNLGYPVFETRFGRVGILICHDRHYPEGARALGLNGAEILLVPSATPTASLSVRVWEKELAAHAIFNEYFVAGLNRVGTEGDYTYYGRSVMFDPTGEIICQAGEGEECLIGEFDLDVIVERRRAWQFYRDRRPDTYDILTQLVP